ncbi:putative PH domain-containing protein [Seiridium cardinale]|uniref:PH domain-containing protein n=1 Tax=Seiridium cardinale TaxID=138064 RepID=A0ABR2XMX6_9PEZI
MESRNAAQQIFDGKVAPKTQRRSSLSSIKAPMRVFRSLSISSQISQASNSSETDVASTVSDRRRSTLRKIRSSDVSKQSLTRQASKASSNDYTEVASNSTRPTSPCGTGSRGTSLSFEATSVIKAGPLKEETSVLKTKKEYLVLTPAALFRFKSRLAAIEQFPQVSVPTSAVEALSPVDSIASFKEIGTSADVHIPLEKVVSVFRDEGTKPCFGLEIWWKDPSTSCVFANIELNFALPGDRDDWLKQIQYAVRQRTKTSPPEENGPSDVELDLARILEAKYPHQSAHMDIFPVVPRRPYGPVRSNSNEVKKGWKENSSFFLAFSKNVCFLAHFTRSPSGQRVNPSIVQYGLVTLSKVSAHTNDERFDLFFRLPLDRPKKLELSSRHHRSIVSRLFKGDTYLKPAWPLWTRRETFLIEGESQQMPLPSGEDYGGFNRTLGAFLEGYHSPSINWKVNWRDVKYTPEFQLLSPENGTKYTAHQLLAVFRALRFNDFFKSLSFRGKRSLTRDEFEVVEKSTVLFQEVVAMLLGSESIRHVDFSEVLPKAPTSTAPAASGPPSPVHQGCEVVPPIILLIRSLQSRCKSIILNGNYLGPVDVSEIFQTLQSQPNCLRGLGFSNCQLDEMAIVTLWEGIHEQRHSLEMLQLSSNFGCLEASRVSQTLWEASKLRRLDLSFCLKGTLDGPLFRPWTSSPYTDPWRLEEVNLSGWKINFDTISIFLRYLELEESDCLHQLKLNSCGISGEVATAIFCRIGKGRDIHLHLNSNPLETGSTDWIDLIHGDESPTKLHLDMIEFKHESNFDKLLKALAENSTIEFLSLVGTGPPGRASSRTSSLFSEFLEKNNTLQYLDFSGYSGKLEDAHLGWGLSGALGGLKHNESLRQLRIRNHDMGATEDITELCRVIAVNKGLAMVDMENNGFDHHQLSKLVHALELNHQIISFPISDADRGNALEKEKKLFIKNLKKPFKGSLSKSDGARLEGLLDWLRGHWDTEAKKAEEILQRNRDKPLNQALELDSECLGAWDDANLPLWLTRKPSGRDKSKTRNTMISRSSTFSDVTLSRWSAFSETPSSPTHIGNIGARGFGLSSEPALNTYTIEEEDVTPNTESDPSPMSGSSEDARTPMEGGNAARSLQDDLWMKGNVRQKSYRIE